MVDINRAVLVRYTRNDKKRRASGLHVAGRFVLTADHCAEGSNHRVIAGGAEHPATVYARTGSAQVDVAILEVPGLEEVPPAGCARVDRGTARTLEHCVALGFPKWKKSSAQKPLLAQLDCEVPTAEGVDPQAASDSAPMLSMKINNQGLVNEHPLPTGRLDEPSTPWAGMSGAALVSEDDLVLGVVRSHSPTEGLASLTVTGLDAIDTLPAATAAALWAVLGVEDSAALPVVPPPKEEAPAVEIAAAQVVVGEIPREPPGFVVRRAVAELAAAVDRSPEGVVTAVTGLRGVGKSHVAAAYARRRIHDGWPLVAWVAADTIDAVVTGLARAADEVRVADPEGDSTKSARKLREYLEGQSRPALLVFDNAENADLVRRFIPATGRTQIVVTTTAATFYELGDQVAVGQFNRPESVAYLARRTGIDDPNGADRVADAASMTCPSP